MMEGAAIDLLQKANEAPIKEGVYSGCRWKHIAPIISVLRKKNYTYKQVSEWLTKEAFKCTPSDVSQAHRRYLKKK
jgi:hypothetical protein